MIVWIQIAVNWTLIVLLVANIVQAYRGRSVLERLERIENFLGSAVRPPKP